MWLRRAFFSWLLPAAFVLPLWLLVGWAVFQRGAGSFLWVLFIAVPSVFIGQIVLTLLVRARPTVRDERALSWGDVAGFSLWHALTVAVGFFGSWFVGVLAGSIVVAVALFWLTLWQLWNEARSNTGRIMLRYSRTDVPASGGGGEQRDSRGGDVIVMSEAAGPREDLPPR